MCGETPKSIRFGAFLTAFPVRLPGKSREFAPRTVFNDAFFKRGALAAAFVNLREGIISMKNNVSKLLALFSVLLLVACVGCGGRSQVHGKVVFSDGSPLTYGTVNFTSGEVMCKGQIEKDGTFKMRTFKPGDGVPPGTYKVYITDTLQFGDSGQTVTTGNDENAASFSVIGQATNTVPYQYSSPDESPIPQVTVKGSIKDLTITIEGSAPEKAPGEGE